MIGKIFFLIIMYKDVIASNDVLFELTDNTVFTYNITTKEANKLSLVNGLSEETTTTIHYNTSKDRIIIGYNNGLLEIVNQDGSIAIAPDIVNFNQTRLKSMNHIYEYENKLYLSTALAVIMHAVSDPVVSMVGNGVVPVLAYSETIKDIKSSENNFIVSLDGSYNISSILTVDSRKLGFTEIDIDNRNFK